MAAERGTFGRMGFVLAAVGSAIGLGNIWKFPYITYANEGGSFVLVYLVAVALIGAPIMFAEILIGRRTQTNPVGAFGTLGAKLPGGRLWRLAGGLGVLTGFVLLSYYAVIAGWTVFYFGKGIGWSINGFDPDGGTTLGDSFGAFLANGPLQILFHGIFVALTVGVVVLGVKEGIERVTKVLMPILAGILVLLLFNSLSMPGFGEALRFLFHVGPLDADAALEAVGHAFFTLSLGMGAMVTYGSYMSRKSSIPRSSLAICVLDTVVALAASMIMFSIIFSVPEAERATTFGRSSTILFTTLPQMFYGMALGRILAPLFYILVAFAALTSTISILEVVVSYLVDMRGWARQKAAPVVGIAVFALGIPCGLSLGASEELSGWRPLGDLAQGVFDTLDYTVSNWLLPIGGLLTAIFAGWLLSSKLTREEIEEGHGPFPLFAVWKFALRFIGPIAILWILWAVIQGRSFA
ncbi:MAG TPA: sodium-dependent transporter [Thermoanaerobaculia bacterium]|nr:sodium-dependent transporter [Thermoanaerobaculia bacterium]